MNMAATAEQRSEGPGSLSARGVTKSFGTQRALDRVDFTLHPGEIHGLLGENGAGKSTLMNVLAGVVRPDEGSVTVDGRPLRLGSPPHSAAVGIGMVHQHFSLIPALTVAENLSLAACAGPAFFRRSAALAPEGLSLASRFRWEIDPETPVWQLSIGRQQRLEILKTLQRHARWLLFDEPTAVLSPPEVEELFSFLGRLRQEGRSIVLISHKLGEVLRLCDRITVLHRGRVAGELMRGTTAEELARLMIGEAEPPSTEPDPARKSGTGIGEEPSYVRETRVPVRPGAKAREEMGEQEAKDGRTDRPLGRPAHAPDGAVASALLVRELHVLDDRGVETVRGLTFEVSQGEVFGIAGIDGNGQAELAEAVVGLRAPSSGSASLPPILPGNAPACPVERPGYIPQDRRRTGLVLPLSVRENLALEIHAATEFCWGPFLRRGRLWEATRAMMSRFDVRTVDDRLPASALSGGNQQKIVVARALTGERSLLVAVNPTRGLDLQSTRYVRRQLIAARDAGVGVLLISTELDEVLELSDRVGILFEGQFQAIVAPTEPLAHIGKLMGGAAAERTPA
jgi:ABC-type uncharacterized transport system ATPase subunit